MKPIGPLFYRILPEKTSVTLAQSHLFMILGEIRNGLKLAAKIYVFIQFLALERFQDTATLRTIVVFMMAAK